MSKGTLILAPGQREEVKKGIIDRGYAIFEDSNLPVDAKIPTPFGKPVLIELKTVPDDLVSSIRQSGRMSRQNIALGSNDGPSILMCVGYPKFEWRYDSKSGNRHYMMMQLTNRGYTETGLTYGEMQGRFLTLAMIGVWPCFVPNWESVPETLCGFYDEFQNQAHRSHLVRPKFSGGNILESWPKPGKGDLINHIFQGFESVGYKKANDIWRDNGSIMKFVLNAAIHGEKGIAATAGVGLATARKIMKQLNAEWKDYNK